MCNEILQSQKIWSARMQEWRKKSAQTHLPHQHAICKHYMKWSTCTCVDRNRLLLTDHTSKLMFVSFYSLNVKGYFQSLLTTFKSLIWTPLVYITWEKASKLWKFDENFEVLTMQWGPHLGTYPWCHSSLSCMAPVKFFVFKSANKI